MPSFLLTQPDSRGLTSNLLDFEGFPRSDIDVHAVRAQRHHLAAIERSYKDYRKKLSEQKNKILFAIQSVLHQNPRGDPFLPSKKPKRGLKQKFLNQGKKLSPASLQQYQVVVIVIVIVILSLTAAQGPTQ
ncbi:hypothetical protein IFM89_011056 [Coptis chinensis]|uniref:Nas2 N-terminal domain-containing protein n=1 Tax=Coptis chinensis TaxID=261450 RepID=A0A835ME11_9MAGN|nr:hypothetical protein IFM89_011056 [Coptis chinensis]